MKQLTLFDMMKSKFKITNKIRLIELFAGIGSQAMALRDLGADFEHYRVIEFDKFAIKSYNAIHGTDFQATDIRNVKGGDLGITDTDKYTYLMTYSFPCFTGDTLVLTNFGYKEIKDISVGDYVLTHNNKWEMVDKIFNNGMHETVKIKTSCTCELSCTKNHKIYCCNVERRTKTKWENGKSVYVGTEVKIKNEGWKEAEKIGKDDYVLFPVIRDEIPYYTENEYFWYVAGRYLADGCQRKKNGKVTISCNEEKLKTLLDAISKTDIEYKVRKGTSCLELDIYGNEFSEFIKNNIGHGAKEKFISSSILKLPKKELEGFLDGYISGDGSVDSKGCTIFTSVNQKIIFSIQQIVAKLYNIVPSVSKIKENGKKIICGIKCNASDWYEAFYYKKAKYHKSFLVKDGKIWVRVMGNIYSETENVYDITVQNEHSFVANNIGVHNCQDLSVAGKQAGMSENSNTRSSLLWQVKRLLNETENLPQILLLENVPAVHSEKNMPDFQEWIDFLFSKGYSNYWQDLNAKNYGVAQNRNRCFMVSILGAYDYTFPSPVPLTKAMKDYLENEVDDKYYINTEKAQKLIDKLIENGMIKEKFNEMEVKQVGNLTENAQRENPQRRRVYDAEGLSPTLTASMGMGGNLQPFIVAETKKLGNIYGFDGGNYAENVYDSENIAPTLSGRNPDNPSDRTAGSPTEQRLEPNSQGICNTLTTVQKDCLVLERGENQHEKGISIEILRVLRKEIGEKGFSEWAIGGIWCILAKEILRQNVYAKSIFEDWKNRPDLFKCSYNGKDFEPLDITENEMRDMWERWKIRCSSYRRKLSEQQCREFDDIVQKLPYETTSNQKFLQDMWEASKGIGILRKALSEIQEIWKSNDCKEVQRNIYRIRKLTPLEVWRLMDFSDEDFHKAESVNSNSQLYKQAGNSLIRVVMAAILSQLNIDDVKPWNESLVQNFYISRSNSL